MELFPTREQLIAKAEEFKEAYGSASPFPSIYFEDFFDEKMLSVVLDEFADMSSVNALNYQNKREVKLQGNGEEFFGDLTKRLMHFLNSEVFLEFIQTLTGIKEPLIGDPYYIGGGQHEIKNGGFLKIHADFNKHKTLGLDRRVNVLVYLNKDWKDEYGGCLELWDQEMKQCVTKIKPKFNTVAIFSTTDFSFHGLPDPVTIPDSMSRKSLALYYYSNGRPLEEVAQGEVPHGTIFRARPGSVEDKLALNIFNDPKRLLRDLVPPLVLKMIRKNKTVR